MRRHLGVRPWGRLLSTVTALSVAGVMLGTPAAVAVTKPKGLWHPHAQSTQPSVPVRNAVPRPVPATKSTSKPFTPASVSWPAAASADLSLAATGSASTSLADAYAGGAHSALTEGPRSAPRLPAAPHAAAGVPLLVGAAGSLDTGDLPPTGAARAALAANDADATPGMVHVAVASRAVAERAGVNGLMVSIARTDSSPVAERVSVALDYSSIRDAFGGGYADSLRLESYPACVLTTPQVKACDTPTPVTASANVESKDQLVADITLPAAQPAARTVDAAAGSSSAAVRAAAAAPQSGVVVLTATPDASGTSGSYAASPVNDSSKWGTSGNTGAFTYSYPITTPPSVGGSAPKLSLSYDSQDADGRTSQTNGQGSWAGDGWTMWPGMITRAYRSCADDGQASTETDECWAGDNATVTLNGASHQLVLDDATGIWHLADDDGSQVFELPGSDFGISNGLNNNTFWALRDRTGTVYVFGADHLPGTGSSAAEKSELGTLGGTSGIGTDASTNAAWGVPVYGNNAGEPCYSASGFNSSSCMQGWQWNLDFVIAPSVATSSATTGNTNPASGSNVTVYTYAAETNYYAAGTTHTLITTPYVRGGTLSKIAYGWKVSDYLAKANAAATVTFTGDPNGRCSSTGFTCAPITTATASHWPDVPYYENCAKTGACTNYSPTFWTNDRLTGIATAVWDTSLKTPGYRNVDTYTLSSNDFQNPGDGTTGVNNSTTPEAMWLDSITHTGADTGGGGAAVTENPVSFKYTFFPNRVPGLIEPAVTPDSRGRLTSITTETGSKITVTYESDLSDTGNPCARTSPPAEDHDTLTCYPVRWTPPGYTAPILDWFNKYLVGTVSVADNTTTNSPAQLTSYTYKQGGAAWRHDDDNITAPKYRTWDEFRGFDQVTTTTGATPDPISQTVTQYLQGMNGDSNLDGTTKSVSVANDAGDTITDNDAWAGTAYETTTYSQAGSSGTPQSRSMTAPWISPATATHVRSTSGDTLPALSAYFTGTASAYSDTLIDATASPETWRLSDTVTTNNPATGLVTSVDDRGEVDPATHLPISGGTTPEKCTTTTYASSTPGTVATVPAAAQTLISGLPAEVATLAGNCSATETAADTLSDTKTFYDGSTTLGMVPVLEADGKTPATGEATLTTSLKDWNGTAGAAEWTTPTAVAYDAYGRVTSTTDAMGRTTGTAYNPAGTKFLPTSVTTTNPKLWQSTVTLDVARALPIASSDVNKQVTTETYDGLGRLTQVWLPTHPQAANATTPNDLYTYNVSATGPSWTDTQKLRDDLSYSQDYKIYDSLQQLREEQTTPPDATANARLIADTQYNSHGQVVYADTAYFNSASAPNGTFSAPVDAGIPQATVTAYDAMGRVLTATDQYNSANQWVTTTSYPLGDEVDTVPPAGGTPTAVITDARGQKTELRQFHGASDTGAYDSTTYGYDADGRQTMLKDSSGNIWTTTYDALGDKVASTDPDTGTSSAVYDNDGEATETLNSLPNSYGDITTTYDNLGRATDTYAWNPTTSTFSVHLTHTAFDPTGDLGQVAGTTSYDTAGNAWSSTISGYTPDYLPTGSTTTVPGAAIGSTNSITYTTSTTYNPVSRTVNTTNLPGEGNMPAETLSYLYNQNALPVTLGNNSDTYVYWTDYNHLGQVLDTTMGDPGTEVVQSYTYNPSTSSLLGYTLDAQAASSTGGSLELDNVSYTYDAAGQQTSDTDVQAGTAVTGTDAQCYQYDYLGRLSQAWTDTVGTTTAPAPQVPGDGACTTTAPSTSTLGGTSPYWQSYTYDATGNRKTETDHSPLGSAGDNTTTSLYNAVTATNASGSTQTMPHGIASTSSTSGGGAQTFSYDAVGDTTEIQQTATDVVLASGATMASGTQIRSNSVRLAMQSDGNLVLYSLKSGQALWSSNTTGNPGATATMTAAGSLTVTSSTGTTLWSTATTSTGAYANLKDDGNLVLYSATGTVLWNSDTYGNTYDTAAGANDIKLTYDHNGRLATTTQGTVTSSYTYDASGNLIARTDSSPGLTTLFLGDDQITVTSTGTITGDTRSYAFAGAPTTIRTSTSGSTSTTLQYQANDPQGTATVQISADNKTIVRRMYTPFGTDRTPDGNPTTWAGTKGYIGGTQDNQTGLTNEGAREYDPTLGRFLSRDRILDAGSSPQQWNGYAYSNNDPTNSSDPTGNRLECGQNGDPSCPSSCPNGRCAVPPTHSTGSSSGSSSGGYGYSSSSGYVYDRGTGICAGGSEFGSICYQPVKDGVYESGDPTQADILAYEDAEGYIKTWNQLDLTVAASLLQDYLDGMDCADNSDFGHCGAGPRLSPISLSPGEAYSQDDMFRSNVDSLVRMDWSYAQNHGDSSFSGPWNYIGVKPSLTNYDGNDWYLALRGFNYRISGSLSSSGNLSVNLQINSRYQFQDQTISVLPGLHLSVPLEPLSLLNRDGLAASFDVNGSSTLPYSIAGDPLQ